MKAITNQNIQIKSLPNNKQLHMRIITSPSISTEKM